MVCIAAPGWMMERIQSDFVTFHLAGKNEESKRVSTSSPQTRTVGHNRDRDSPLLHHFPKT